MDEGTDGEREKTRERGSERAMANESQDNGLNSRHNGGRADGGDRRVFYVALDETIVERASPAHRRRAAKGSEPHGGRGEEGGQAAEKREEMREGGDIRCPRWTATRWNP